MREVISPEIRLVGCLDIFQLTVSSLKIHMLNLVIVGGEACLVTLVGGGTMNAKGLSPYSIWGVSKLQLSRDYAPPPLSLYSPSLWLLFSYFPHHHKRIISTSLVFNRFKSNLGCPNHICILHFINLRFQMPYTTTKR